MTSPHKIVCTGRAGPERRKEGICSKFHSGIISGEKSGKTEGKWGGVPKSCIQTSSDSHSAEISSGLAEKMTPWAQKVAH